MSVAAVWDYQQQEVAAVGDSNFWAPSQQAATGAVAERSSVVGPLDTPRYFDDLLSGLADLVPDVPLDAPTIMSIIMIAAFVIQFYWSLISLSLAQASAAPSSSSASSATTTTTTTTTAAALEAPPAVISFAAAATTTNAAAIPDISAVVTSTPRTQTVTPAPPPEWGNFIEDFHLPHWVVKCSPALLKWSGVQYLKKWDADMPTHSQAQNIEKLSPLQGPGQTVDNIGHDRGMDYTEESWYRSNPRMSLHYGTSGAGGNGWDVEDLGHIEDLEELREFLGEPLSSHRLISLPEEQEDQTEEGKTASGIAARMLYNAERWGHRLEDWNVLSPDGAQMLTHTILMMRCAVLSPDYCAKLDHYFRRQHDLNLVAAMMNHHTGEESQDYGGSDDYHDYSYHDWLPETGTSMSPPWIDRGPGRLYDGEQNWNTRKQGKNNAQERQEQQHHKKKQDKKRRVKTGGDLENSSSNSSSSISNNRTWNIYIFMSVMAVLVFLMDASYRILRAMTTNAAHL